MTNINLQALCSDSGHWKLLPECTVLQQRRDEYYTADLLGTLFETIRGACIVEF